MVLESDKSDSVHVQPPLELSRRSDGEAENTQNQASAIDSVSPEPMSMSNNELSTEFTYYSARSEILSPLKLFSDIFSDFYQGRELAWRLFLRNIRGLYRQTLLGLFWAFLPPIANTAIWVFLREANILDTGKMEVNSTAYILTGMILWQAFIDAFQMPLGMLNKNRNMISKLNFPRESLLLVGIGEVCFDLAIRSLLLI
ncbi:MAG: hypothetical protein AAF623_21730, partial [Planctomycetota bacterium]